MIYRLIEIVDATVLQLFKMDHCVRDVLILESSSEKKSSFHLVFPKLIFLSPMHCKEFVVDLIENMSVQDRALFDVIDSTYKKKVFIDTAVYSKNQNFRLMLSHKQGKKEELFVSKESIGIF